MYTEQGLAKLRRAALVDILTETDADTTGTVGVLRARVLATQEEFPEFVLHQLPVAGVGEHGVEDALPGIMVERLAENFRLSRTAVDTLKNNRFFTKDHLVVVTQDVIPELRLTLFRDVRLLRKYLASKTLKMNEEPPSQALRRNVIVDVSAEPPS